MASPDDKDPELTLEAAMGVLRQELQPYKVKAKLLRTAEAIFTARQGEKQLEATIQQLTRTMEDQRAALEALTEQVTKKNAELATVEATASARFKELASDLALKESGHRRMGEELDKALKLREEKADRVHKERLQVLAQEITEKERQLKVVTDALKDLTRQIPVLS